MLSIAYQPGNVLTVTSQGTHFKIPGGEEGMKLNCNFKRDVRGNSSQNNNYFVGGVWIFSGTACLQQNVLLIKGLFFYNTVVFSNTFFWCYVIV